MPLEPQPNNPEPNPIAPTQSSLDLDPSPEIQAQNQKQLIDITHRLVSAQSHIDLINHLQSEHLKQQEITRSLSQNPNQSAPLSEIESFLDSSHLSPLVNLSTYQKVLEITKIPIQLLDPSDTSDETLWNYVPTNLQEELLSHLHTAKTQESILQSLQSQVERHAPKLWEEYLLKEQATQTETLTQLRQLIFGINDPEQDQSFLTEIPQIKHNEALLCLEKTRVLVAALTAEGDQNRKETEATAIQILGPEAFALYKDQTSHLQKLLESRNKHPNTPLEDPENQLLSNSFKTIFPAGLSKPQLATLQAAFQTLSQTPPQDFADVKSQTISCILATLSLHQQGLKATICNTFETIRKEKEELIKTAQQTALSPEPQGPSSNKQTKPKDENQVKAGLLNVENMKNIFKHGAQALALYKGAQKFVCNHSHHDPENNFGSRGETMEQLKKLGITAMDQM
jgi:hypothetical protein